jgi:3-keto-disaccharide hydrolase
MVPQVSQQKLDQGIQTSEVESRKSAFRFLFSVLRSLPSIVCLLFFILCFLSSCADLSGSDPVLQTKKAIEACDPFMGDWRGSWKLADGSDSGPLVAQVIALGKGTYEAKCFAQFDTREQPMLVLKGQREGRIARFSGGSAPDSTGAQLKVQAVIDRGTFSGTLEGDMVGSFTMGKTIRLSPTLGAKPPADAVVLFDGKGFDAWEPVSKKAGVGSVQWKQIKGGAMEVKKGAGSIVTKKKFSDFKLHLEFRTPFMPEQRGQERGNSGVYLQGRYEVQILDSYGLKGLDNECGGIYKVAAPLVNMCSPPMQWQTYDITFTAPRFDSAGVKTQDAIVTIVHNGVTIHDRLKIPKPTGGALDNHVAEPGGIVLQDHGNPVQFRNIWLVEL